MTPQETTCDLCGLPNPDGRVVTYESEKQTYRFCCPGCRQVFIMLMEASDSPDPAAFRQSELFKKCREMGIIPRSQTELETRLRQGPSSPQVPQTSTTPSESGASNSSLDLNLRVSDMWCPACAWVIEEALKQSDGIHMATCNFSIDRVRCKYDPVRTSPVQIIETIESLGYQATSAESQVARGKHREFIRFSVAAFFTMNIMMLSFALYTGFFTTLSPEAIYKLSWPLFAMATIVLFYSGQGIYKKALAGLPSASFGMETLITAGAFTAYIFSTVNLLSGSIHLYYDTAAMLITLTLLGKWLEKRAKIRVLADLEAFFALQPAKVRLCSRQYPQGRYAGIQQLHPGDTFQVTEGETLPADGKVTGGSGAVNESSLTGESVPLRVRPGDRVRSGTLVVSGTFRVRADGVGAESTLGQMVQVMERALDEKSPLEGRTDRVLQWFVPAIITLAVGTGFVCKLAGLSSAEAMLRAVTVMVISCPCALGVAIPLARVAGISLAGKKGILVRAFSGFEQAAEIRALVFDKTGTITQGRWELLDIITFPPGKPDEALAAAAGLENGSGHYIGAEITRRAAARNLPIQKIADIREFENGRTGVWHGAKVTIGSRSLLSAELETFDMAAIRNRFSEDVIPSFVFMGHAGKIYAVFVFGDKVRPAAKAAIDTLTARGYDTYLISGDDDRTTRRVAGLIGIEKAAGGKLPGDKVEFIKALQKAGHPAAMIGDGINDAPALVQADLSMAVHSGSHLGHEVADITLMRGDPGQVIDFLNLARPVNRKIVQNLLCAFAYNIISIPIAMGGLLSPLVAVTAMLLSSLTVIGNTLRLVTKGTE
jgi:heavy metal translocating P-type ATPase